MTPLVYLMMMPNYGIQALGWRKASELRRIHPRGQKGEGRWPFAFAYLYA